MYTKFNVKFITKENVYYSDVKMIYREGVTTAIRDSAAYTYRARSE